MSLLALVPNLGRLSNREIEFQTQNILAIGPSGRLRFAPFPRRDPLPPEILAEIFIHCLPDEDFIIPALSIAPLILCVICRRWRDVALTTPTLWSSLLFDFNEMWETHGAEMWLSRARATPLSICLYNIPGGPLDSLLKTVIGLSQQWQRIEFGYIRADSASYIFPADGRFPLLESLDISLDGHVAFCEAPRLREVSIDPHNPQIQLPWHQLTIIRCYEVRNSSCFGILRKSSNLLDGMFTIEGDSSGLPTSILEHDHLRYLDLSADEETSDAPLPILGCLKIPGLKNLTLGFTCNIRILPTDMSPFLSFVSRSCCQLHTLTLSYVRTTPDDLIECLKATPSLVYLNLTPFVAVDSVFAQLTGQVAFLPKMRSFHAFFPDKYEISHFDESVVVQMLRWRWAAVGIARLTSFRLGYHKELHFNEAITSHPECQALQAEGMDLQFGETTHIRWLPYL
ncbi:hypothetical protein DFH06DRAFT_1075279 [Mycena polygramma]|nr:hypothetical protein DFH06DRAFT_1075279 [Mycena polygramma]